MPWTLSVTAGAFRAALTMEDGRQATLTEAIVVAGLRRRVSDDIGVAVKVGGVADGTLSVGGRRREVLPGPLVSAEVDWRALEAPAAPLTLSVAAAVSASFAEVRDDKGIARPFTAIDLRLGATASRTIARVLTPSASVRVFGGPVLWEQAGRTLSATDRFHVQLATGLSWAPVPGLSLSFEWAFFGETALFGGVALGF